MPRSALGVLLERSWVGKGLERGRRGFGNVGIKSRRNKQSKRKLEISQ